MIRSAGRSFWRLIGRPWVLTLAVVMLAVSAISGNVFQNADRSSLKSNLEKAEDRIEVVQGQLDEVKGQQECRARIASESELYSGRLLAALGQLVVAAQEQDDAAREAAVTDIASATVALGPALDARLASVEICERSPEYRTPVTPFTEVGGDPLPTTTVAPLRGARPRPKATTTTSPRTTSTTFHSSPTPSDPACQLLPGLTVPQELPCP